MRHFVVLRQTVDSPVEQVDEEVVRLLQRVAVRDRVFASALVELPADQTAVHVLVRHRHGAKLFVVEIQQVSFDGREEWAVRPDVCRLARGRRRALLSTRLQDGLLLGGSLAKAGV